jgi:phage shock protein C
MKTYNKKLHKSKNNKVITGTLGGVGEFFNVDPNIFRAVCTGIVVFAGILPGILVYVLVAIIIPKKPEIIQEKAL